MIKNGSSCRFIARRRFSTKTFSWILSSAFAGAKTKPILRLGTVGSLLYFAIRSSSLFQLMHVIKLSSSFFLTGLVDHFTFFTRPGLHPTAIYQYAHENYLWNFSLIVSPRRGRPVTSGDSIFPSLWWLERESAELTGFLFCNKSDNRNLLLEYCSFQTPLAPSFPSVGFFEISFCFVFLLFLQTSPSVQA